MGFFTLENLGSNSGSFVKKKGKRPGYLCIFQPSRGRKGEAASG